MSGQLPAALRRDIEMACNPTPMFPAFSLGLGTPGLAATPNLHRYRWIVISTSGGKDSQTALRQAVLECIRQGYPLDRVIAVHADLGRVEWSGVPELACEQAEAAGIASLVVTRIGGRVPRGGRTYAKGEHYGDLLEDIRRYGKFPGSTTRYCTSGTKRAPVRQFMIELASRARREGFQGAVPILHVMGLRADESPNRAKLAPFEIEQDLQTRRVDRWLPIHGWTGGQVWRDIWASGVRYHEAYDWGMPRLSCSICIFAGRAALRLAIMLRPELAREYATVEREIGHKFTAKLAIGDLVDSLDGLDVVTLARDYGHESATTWAM